MLKGLEALTWLPPYRTYKTRAAKCIRITVEQANLRITYPPHASQREILALVLDKKAWILTHWHALQETHTERQAPDELTLHTLNELWRISYDTTSRKPGFYIPEAHHLMVLTNPAVASDIPNLLKTWLMRYAKHHLPPLLHTLASVHGLPINRVTIRDTKSRWGSCSAQHNISLNYKLLFLPHALTQHVMLHELAHTRVMNHSRMFWDTLRQLDPHCDAHNRALKSAAQYLPDSLK